MYCDKMSPDKKVIEFKQLNETISEAKIEICDMIKAKHYRARELAEHLDNSDLIANITTLLQNAIEVQEQAAAELVNMSNDVLEEINAIYADAEQDLIKIKAKI